MGNVLKAGNMHIGNEVFGFDESEMLCPLDVREGRILMKDMLK